MKMEGTECSLYVDGIVGASGRSAIDFTQCVQQAVSLGSTKITVYINSMGGYCFDGVAMGDALLNCGVETVGVVLGTAQSMASYILECCQTRYANVGATLMFHQPTSRAEGTVEDIERDAAHFRALRERMFAQIASRSGGYWPNAEAVSEDLARGKKIFTAEEAAVAGLIDQVITVDNHPSMFNPTNACPPDEEEQMPRAACTPDKDPQDAAPAPQEEEEKKDAQQEEQPAPDAAPDAAPAPQEETPEQPAPATAPEEPEKKPAEDPDDADDADDAAEEAAEEAEEEEEDLREMSPAAFERALQSRLTIERCKMLADLGCSPAAALPSPVQSAPQASAGPAALPEGLNALDTLLYLSENN